MSNMLERLKNGYDKLTVEEKDEILVVAEKIKKEREEGGNSAPTPAEGEQKPPEEVPLET